LLRDVSTLAVGFEDQTATLDASDYNPDSGKQAIVRLRVALSATASSRRR